MMTPAVPSSEEIRLEEDPVRKALLAGMRRVLLGQPRAVGAGALSFSDLATESGVPRHHLYQTHPDLKDRFEFLRDKSSAPTLAESELRQKVTALLLEVERLQELQNRTREQSRNWKALSEVFERAINVLQEELRREQITSARLSKKVAKLEGLPGPATIVQIRPSRTL